MPHMAYDLDKTRENIASGIRRVTSDSGSTELQPLKEQLQGLRALAAEEAARGKRLGIRMVKIRPGDALGNAD